MPPLAIVFGPPEVPVGEKGCLTSATRTLPSGVVYFCAWMSGATQKNRIRAIDRRMMSLDGRIVGGDKRERLNIPQKSAADCPTMSDTLQEALIK